MGVGTWVGVGIGGVGDVKDRFSFGYSVFH